VDMLGLIVSELIESDETREKGGEKDASKGK
jgi:hypothetical protein